MLAKCRLDDVGPMSRRVAHRCRPDIETDIGPILKPTSVRHRPDMECLLGIYENSVAPFYHSINLPRQPMAGEVYAEG